MNISKAINEMIGSLDYEVAYIGEMLRNHKESYISELMRLGFERAEAEKGLARFCMDAVEAAACGEDVTFPNYKEEFVARIARFCRARATVAA